MIIDSLLDLDFYKLTMAQVAWRLHPHVPVTYGFTNRTKRVRVADVVDEEALAAELDHCRTLRFTVGDVVWLAGLKLFEPEFLAHLLTVQLPPYELRRLDDGQYRIEVSGSWPQAIFWETLILSVVNELYYRALMAREGLDAEAVRTEGRRRVMAKADYLLRAAPDARVIEFGTRRRFSGPWQREALSLFQARAPQLVLGTSNVLLARDLGLPPIGTMAHEMFMVYSGIYDRDDDSLRDAHGRVLDDWWLAYGDRLSVALTDTYGTDFFFRDFEAPRARLWRGLRQDSGDPVAFGERAIDFYQKLGLDPRQKMVVFSDGLDEQAVAALHQRFAGRLGHSFGWGTNLTNDLGLAPLSLVVKVIEANGRPTVKLSDNPAKAMGPTEAVERFKRVFGYVGGLTAECVY